MRPRVEFGPEASAELEDAAQWYEERRPGLGLTFLAAVDIAVESLARWPRSGAPVPSLPADLNARRVPVGRFPYYVAYIVTGDLIRVLAVAHERRRPVYWSGRAQ